ncbi:MAG: tetratricopeptide repeat protein [Terriglobales bacterium]|jgi:DNA-binding winged helix-turn-helix (wHTH) protein/tetratricopeptide (TPR) repeat protein
MGTTPGYSRIVSFGLFTADLEKRELRKDGVRIKLHGQPFEILTLLLERAGEVVTREEIRARLWPGNTFVEFDNGLNVAVKKLRTALGDDADNARFVKTVPKRGYRFVVPVSTNSASFGAVTPIAVTHTAATPATTVERETPAPTPQTAPVPPPASDRSRQRELIVALMVVLLALAGIAAYRWRASIAMRAAAKSNSGFQAAPRRSVAVLGFRNLPGRPEEDWLSTAFTEMLSTELAAGGGLRMVSGEDVSRAKRDLQIAETDSLAKSTLANLRINPGADLVVLGTCTPIVEKGQKRIRIDVRLQDTDSGETIDEEAFTGAEESLFEVASQAGARLREKLGTKEASPEAMTAARASLPSNQQARRLLAEGRAKFYEFDFLDARNLLVKAVAADAENAATHAALADAWSALGYVQTAQDEAKRALDLSATLSREEQLSIEGRYRELTWDWPKAIEIYHALTQFFPDNLDYGLRLASVLSKGGRAQDSLHEIDVLRHLAEPTSDDPRIDLQEAATFDRAGEYQTLQTAAASAALKAEKRGTHFLSAEAKLEQSLAASRLNDPKGALVLDEDAQELYRQVGDKYGLALARYRMADLLFQQGRFAESNALLEQCLQTYRALGSDGDAAQALNDIAGGLLEMGEIGKARTMYEEALAGQRLVRSKRGIAEVLTNLGALLEMQGDLDQARRYDEEALALYKELGEKGALAYVQGNMATVLVDLGDLSAGKDLFDGSLALQRELGNESSVAEYTQNIAGTLAEQGDVAGAQKLYDEALAIQVNLGEQANAAGTRLNKAELMTETGQAANAEPLARSALDQFQKEKQIPNEISAHDTLAEIFLQLGRLPEAKTELARAAKLADRNQTRTVRLKTEIVAARVLAAAGNPGEATRNLRAAISEAQKSGFFVRQLDASLALAEIQAKSGHQRDALVLLQSVEKEARSRGFLLIARRATAARS